MLDSTLALADLTDALAADLRAAGFSIVALDLAAGRCTVGWALDHVRRTLPLRNERGRASAQAVLSKWADSRTPPSFRANPEPNKSEED